MLRFVARRVGQMVPTILGVILVTFILFNVVGGSPARMKLGERASPQMLEEYDEQRGFNRPLIFGTRVQTRAWPDQEYSRDAGAWSRATNVPHTVASGGARGYVTLAAATPVVAPLAFDLKSGAEFEWRAVWRRAGENAWKESSARFAGGDEAADALRRLAPGSDIEIASLRLRRIVERPWESQLVFFLGQLARLDFGMSGSANQPVIDVLAAGILPTLALAGPILVLETVLGVSLALLCALYRDRWPDRLAVFASVVLMSVNYLVWIVGGQYLFAYRLGWFPVWGFASWAYLLLPVLIGTVSGLGTTVRFYRTVMLDEMYKEYVRTAFAKGLGRRAVLFRHVLPNAMIPVITNVVLSLPFLYTGSLLLESFFGIPGLGYLAVNAINDSDVDVVRAVVVIGSALFLVSNLVADLMYAWVDPRVRLE